MIVLTEQWTQSGAARAVPGAYFDGERKAWCLEEATPRAAAVALKLFPGIGHDYPELIEARDTLVRDAHPVDYATPFNKNVNAPRVQRIVKDKGWKLHDYQRTDLGYGVECLRQHGGFYMGWARGLGKTLATCLLIDALEATSTIVIAPNTSKQSVWEDALAEFCPWTTVLVLPNVKAKRERCLRQVKELGKAGTPFVLVVHYEALAVIAGPSKQGGLGDGWKRLGVTFDLAVADEGHRIANPDSKMARAAKRVPRKASVILSGSVFQNKWEEMFSPLQWLFPDRYKSKWRDWNDRFLDYVENGYSKVCVGIKPEQVEAMRDELGRFMVYRDKESKAEVNTILVPLTESQSEAYAALQEECLARLEDGTTVKGAAGVAMLMRLRQIATGLDLFGTGIKDSSKLDVATDLIARRAAEGDQFVAFVWFKAAAHSLAERLEAEGIESFVVTGDVAQKDRGEFIKRFQAGERTVFIGTIPTLGESVNLQRANHVVMIDRSYNPALNQQAVDRVDRQGQKRKVYLTHVIAKGTVDELHVLPALANKEALKAAILGMAA